MSLILKSGTSCEYTLSTDQETNWLYISPELEIFFFQSDSYLGSDESLPTLITPGDVLLQACRIQLIHHEPHEEDPGDPNADEPGGLEIWATCGITRVSHLQLHDNYTYVSYESAAASDKRTSSITSNDDVFDEEVRLQKRSARTPSKRSEVSTCAFPNSKILITRICMPLRISYCYSIPGLSLKPKVGVRICYQIQCCRNLPG